MFEGGGGIRNARSKKEQRGQKVVDVVVAVASFARQVFSHRRMDVVRESLKKRGASRSLPKKASFHRSSKDRDTVPPALLPS